MIARVVELRAVALAVAMIAASTVRAQAPRSPAVDPQNEAKVTPSEPSLIWRSDERELPPNTFSMHANAFSPDGRLIGVVNQPNDAWLQNAADGSLFYRLPYASEDASSPGGVYSIAFSPTGEFAVGRRYGLELFDARGGSLQPIDCGKCGLVGAVTFSADGSLLAFQEIRGPTFPGDPKTALVDVHSNRVLRSVNAASNRPQVALAPNGRQLLASSFSRIEDRAELGFEVWNMSDGTTSLKYRGEPRANLGWIAAGGVEGHAFVAVYGRKDSLEMRDLVRDQVIWTAPLIPPLFAPPNTKAAGSEFYRGAIAPNGRFIISYESPRALGLLGYESGGIVVRSAMDGRVVAIYDVYGVTALSISPDSKTFVYSTGAGKVHTALVRMPEEAMP